MMTKENSMIIIGWLKDKLVDVAINGDRKRMDAILQIIKMWKEDYSRVSEAAKED